MAEKRVYSLGESSGVYHFDGCAYANRIKDKHKVWATFREVTEAHMRPCTCCNSAAFHAMRDEAEVKRFCKRYGIEVFFDGQEVYVGTKVGFWKLHYSRRHQKYCVFHGNGSDHGLTLEQMQQRKYHRQSDHPLDIRLICALEYIRKHDQFKADLAEARRNPQRELKVAPKYQDSFRRSQERYARRRVRDLFRQIEAQNPELKQLSIY